MRACEVEKKELLEQLRNKTNCMIISDLKFVDREILYQAINSLHSEDYSINEWRDAILYLSGSSVEKNISKAAAKEYLCNYYR